MAKVKNKLLSNATAQLQEIFTTINPSKSFNSSRVQELQRMRGGLSPRKMMNRVGSDAAAIDKINNAEFVDRLGPLAKREAMRGANNPGFVDRLGHFMYGKKGTVLDDYSNLVGYGMNNKGMMNDTIVDAYKQNIRAGRMLGSARVAKNTMKDYYVNPFKEKNYKAGLMRVSATAGIGAGIGAGIYKGSDMLIGNGDKQLY